MQGRLDGMQGHLDGVHGRLDGMQGRLGRLEDKVDTGLGTTRGTLLIDFSEVPSISR